MRKIFNKLFIIIILLFPISVFAAGGISVSPSSLSIEKGKSKTFTITATNTIGDVSISSSNPSVASVSVSEWGTGMVDENQTKAGTITVTGKSAGTTTITLIYDAATFDGEDLAGQKRTITVTVTEAAKPSNTNTNKPTSNTNTNKPSNNNTNSNSNNNLSKNNNLKELSVDGYDLTKLDDNNYILTVSNNVKDINVKAVAEDAKATVTGAGKKNLKVGDNTIEIIVTSESGEQNKTTIKVTRKSDYTLEDLDNLLKDSSNKDLNININSDTIISSSDLSKIKDQKKTVNFQYYDENKKLKYTWIVDGSKLTDVNDLSTNIVIPSSHAKEISKVSNYADGLTLEIKGKISAGTKVKVYVGDKFEEGYVLNLYSYQNNNLKLVSDKLNVKEGMVEFEIDSNDYLITMSNIHEDNVMVVNEEKDSTNDIFMVVAIAELVIILILIILYFSKRKQVAKLKKEVTSVALSKEEVNNIQEEVEDIAISENEDILEDIDGLEDIDISENTDELEDITNSDLDDFK